MLTFWGVVTALTMYGGLPAVAGLWMFERRRSRRRNRSGRCASCGISWTSVPADDPYLIHGRLVCEPCGVRARRRMPWRFGALAAAVAVGSGIALAAAESAMALVPVGSTLAVTLGAVQLMKLANRTARRRIAQGDYPALHALRSLMLEAEQGRMDAPPTRRRKLNGP